jgi:hypothetical protein
MEAVGAGSLGPRVDEFQSATGGAALMHTKKSPSGWLMVGATGLEPATPCSQNKRGKGDLNEAISTILQGISRVG